MRFLVGTLFFCASEIEYMRNYLPLVVLAVNYLQPSIGVDFPAAAAFVVPVALVASVASFAGPTDYVALYGVLSSRPIRVRLGDSHGRVELTFNLGFILN